jgi:hypothetical protein
LAPKRVELLVGLDERFLGKVFGLAHRTGEAKCERMNHALITPDQRAESLMVALDRGADQPCFIIVLFHHAALFYLIRQPDRNNPLGEIVRSWHSEP